MSKRPWNQALLAAALVLTAGPALAAVDTKLELAPTSSKAVKLEKPAAARDFVDRIAVYIRVLPAKGDMVFPVFINTHNYLTCPDSDKRWYLNDVKQVNIYRRAGVKILGFFFDKPDCEIATQHLEAIVAD